MRKITKTQAFGLSLVLVSATVIGVIPLESEKALATVPKINERVSVDSNENQSSGYQGTPDVSKEGRYIVFDSTANNLVSGDTNNKRDIFLRDKVAGTTERVSLDTSENESNNDSSAPKISANGRYITFSSSADNLATGDTNSKNDVFLRDRTNGTTEIVSVTNSGGPSDDINYGDAAVSEDGRFITFYSYATNLVTNDTNSTYDVFVRDRSLGTTKRISQADNGTEANNLSYETQVSCGGRYIVFQSLATNLVAGDTNGVEDVFLVDRLGGDHIINVTLNGNGVSAQARVNCSGNIISFASSASNLVPGDTNGKFDNFIYNINDATFERTSVDSSEVEGNADTVGWPSTVSADGNIVIFASSATNLVSGDTNNTEDIFLRDRLAGTTERISVNSGGTQGNGYSSAATISADGVFLVYNSEASNLVIGDTNGVGDIFISETGASASTVCIR